MSIITTGDIPSLLRPGLEKVGLEYTMYKGEYNKVFETRKSMKYEEVLQEMRYTGYAQEVAQGAAIPISSMGQAYKYQFIHRTFGLGFIITRIAIDDNQYKNQFNTNARALYDSYEQTKEVMAMNMFNQAFNPQVTIGDGQPLCSQNHPIYGGVFSNTFPALVDFSETGVEQMIIRVSKFKNQAGLLIKAAVEAILMPTDLEFSGCRLLESTFRTNTANNDINAIYNMKAIPKGYISNPFLTSPTNWFGLTNVKGTRLHFERTKFETDITTDPDTKSVKTNGMGRYSFGPYTPLGVFGSGAAIA